MTTNNEFLARFARPGTSIALRLFRAQWRQAALTPVCPLTPRLDGKIALVTGGSAGIGFEIAMGLARRGADVIITARGERAAVAAARITADTGKPVPALRLDLGDLAAFAPFVAELSRILAGRALSHFIQNAGVWPLHYAQSAQGHEIAFATNVLGHFALTRRLIEAHVLDPGARIVIHTGDIYVMAHDCSADFKYRGAYGGTLAYCRSKLGNIWFGTELQRRYPAFEIAIVHPGIVASGLVSVGGGMGAAFKQQLLLSPEAGAQTALTLATQSPIVRGAYYHNTFGRMDLAVHDPARDSVGAARLWDRLERLLPV